jgi:hypothetical protein
MHVCVYACMYVYCYCAQWVCDSGQVLVWVCVCVCIHVCVYIATVLSAHRGLLCIISKFEEKSHEIETTACCSSYLRSYHVFITLLSSRHTVKRQISFIYSEASNIFYISITLYTHQYTLPMALPSPPVALIPLCLKCFDT